MRYLREARLIAAVAVLLLGGIALSACSPDAQQSRAIAKVTAVKGPVGWTAAPVVPVCAVITSSCNDPSVSRLWYAPQHTTAEQACTVAYRWIGKSVDKSHITECAQWLRTHPNVNPRKWGGAYKLDENHWVNATQNFGAAAYGQMWAVGVGY